MKQAKYSDQVNIENEMRLRRLSRDLPSFCKEFFRGIEPVTSSRTRIAYGYDMRIFFHFLKEEYPDIAPGPVQSWPVEVLDKVTLTQLEEYLDYIISVKTVKDVDEAIAHINKYNTGHSEAIITEDKETAQRFLDRVDAACVYVNASTRFTDGFEFGFGAEIGISTQKLHARGPMGLLALTSYKYTIYGDGQVRQ